MSEQNDNAAGGRAPRPHLIDAGEVPEAELDDLEDFIAPSDGGWANGLRYAPGNL